MSLPGMENPNVTSIQARKHFAFTSIAAHRLYISRSEENTVIIIIDARSRDG
jgi:hypothetical protein